MRKALIAAVAMVLASLSLAGTAQAQDAVIGTVTADPAQVPAPGEYTMTATGADFIPDSQILLVACISPAETLVPGESDLEEITAAAQAIDALADCDIAAAQNVEVDSEGGFTAELTAEVGDNFFLSAGALDGSQAGATWVPIVGDGAAEEEPAEEEPAEEEPAEEEPAEEEPAEEEPAEEEPAEEEAAEEEPAEEEATEEEAAAEEDLAETGVETGLIAVVGASVLAAGALAVRESRRFRS